MNTKKLLASVLAVALLAGCGSSSATPSTETKTDSETKTASVSGTVSAAGSSALQPLADAAAKKFMEANKDVDVSVAAGGSGNGLKQVADGSVDIGNSDVFAEEKLDASAASKLVDHQVCINVMGAVVNKDLGVTNVSTSDLIGIFTGKITNWKEVGGPDQEIMLFTRPEGSGTRATFEKYAMNGESEIKSNEDDNSGTLATNIKNNVNGIGYISYANIVNDDSLVLLSIDGVEATLDNAYKGTYKVWCYEHMYTNGEGSDAAKAFIDYIMSTDFEPEIEKMGYGAASKLTDAAKATHTN